MPQALTFIATASDGTVYGIAPTGNGSTEILHAQPDTPWIGVSGQLASIGVGSDGTVWGISPAQGSEPGQVLAYQNGAWTNMAGPSNLTEISVGAADYIWVLDSSGTSYQYNSSSNPAWSPRGGALSNIDAASDGSVWGLGTDGQVFQYSYSSAEWQSVTKPSEALIGMSASASGWACGVGQSGKIYQYDGSGNQWLTLAGSPPPFLGSIYCGDDMSIYGIDQSNIAYQYNYEAQVWSEVNALPSPSILAALSVGDAENIWALDSDGNIFQFMLGVMIWTPVTYPAQLATISAGSSNNVWGTDVSGNVYQGVGGIPGKVPGNQQYVSVGEDGTVCGIANGVVTQYIDDAWTQMGSSSNFTAISVGNAENIWALGTENGEPAIYKYVKASWVPVSGRPIGGGETDILTFKQISAASDGSVWALTNEGRSCFFTGPDTGWYVTDVQLQQIAAGGLLNVWGIDTNGNATNPFTLWVPVPPSFEGSIRRRRRFGLPGWDTESVFDEADSTHLWIVNRAATLAGTQQNGKELLNLVQPFQGRIQGPAGDFHNKLCHGLYDADYLPKYNNPFRFLNVPTIIPSYSSHFWYAKSGILHGRNWLGQRTPTALTQCQAFFWKSIMAYLKDDMPHAGYYLGLALHYFTDATQPMHVINLTDLKPFHYHFDFESWVLEKQAAVPTIDPASVPWPTDMDPGTLFMNAAKNTASEYNNVVAYQLILLNFSWIIGLTHADRAFLGPYVEPMLQDAMNYTAQFIYAWWLFANSEIQSGCLVSADSGWVVCVQHASSKAGAPLWQYPWYNRPSESFQFVSLSATDPGYYAIATSVSGYSKVLDIQHGSNQIVQNPYDSSSDTQKWKWEISSSDDKTMRLINKHSQKCLSVKGKYDGVGNMIVQAAVSTNLGQSWILTPAAPVEIVATSTSLRATVPHGSTKPGTQLVVDDVSKHSSRQQFLWVALAGKDDGYYMILSAVSGLALYQSADGAAVAMQSWGDTDQFKWSQVGPENDTIKIRNKYSGKFWALNPNTNEPGDAIVCSTEGDLWELQATTTRDDPEPEVDEPLAPGQAAQTAG